MVDLNKWNRGVVVRPRSGSMVVEVVSLAWQIRRRYVGGDDLRKISDSGCRNNVPHELGSRGTGRRIVDGDLASVGSHELTEIPFQDILRRNCGEQPGIP